MVEDLLSRLREIDARLDESHRQLSAKRAARKAKIDEFWDAWNKIVYVCSMGDERPSEVPDLSHFITFAKVLKDRGWGNWPQEFAETLSSTIDNAEKFRPGPLFITALLIEASKPRASIGRLTGIYRSFNPKQVAHFWRGDGAEAVHNLIVTKLHEVERADADRRLNSLRAAARKRPALAKQLFGVHWATKGLRPAAIRDKWNSAYPKEWIGEGEAGRGDMKTAIRRGREFLKQHEATVAEMAQIAGISLAD